MSQHQQQNEKILDQFTKQAASYARLTGSRPSGATLVPLLKAIAPLATDRVLDVACGTGRMSVSLAKLTKHVTGIDLTAAMIDEAKALQEQSRVTNVDWLVGDVLPLPFPDESFSLVISQAALHHFADPVAVLEEMARVCAADGRIAVSDMSPDPASAKALNEVEKLRDPSHVRALQPAELMGLGDRMGLVMTDGFTYRSAAMPIEAVLRASFPDKDDLENIVMKFREDARSGNDALGLKAELSGGHILVQYPMTVVVWRRRGTPCQTFS